MFMGIWAAWCTIRGSLLYALSSTWAEMLRQPLFGNTHIQSPAGDILGTCRNTNFSLWSTREYNTIADIWDPSLRAWPPAPTIRQTLAP
jgi:hypothetical protein